MLFYIGVKGSEQKNGLDYECSRDENAKIDLQNYRVTIYDKIKNEYKGKYRNYISYRENEREYTVIVLTCGKI